MEQAQTDAFLAQAQSLPARANRNLAHIPGQDGLPLVGDAFPFMRDTLNFQRSMYEKYGPVFRVRIGPDPAVNLIHPDAHKLLTLDSDRLFSTAAGYANTLAELFPKGLLLRDISDHRMHRRIMQTAFKKMRYIPFPKLVNNLPLYIERG